MNKTHKIILLLIIVCGSGFNRSYAQYFTNLNKTEDIFNYEVKVIDEFIERFNDDPNSFIRKTYKSQKKPFTAGRERLLTSLFNLANANMLKDTSLNDFIRQVAGKPELIHFTDGHWYANIVAVINYDNKEMEVPVVLDIMSSKEGWSKWMIAGVGEIAPARAGKSNINYKEFEAKKAPTYISTSAYSTDFVELHYVFATNIDPKNFFEASLLNSEQGKNFVSLVKNGKIHFLYARNMTFSFFQVNNWIFNVEHFKRQSLNSGWLINDIRKVSATEKVRLENKQLLR